MSPALLVRQAALAGVALLAALGALALGGDDGPTLVTSASQVETEALWQEAAVGVRGRPGRRTSCGGVLGAETVGVIHPVLPCGVKIVVRFRELSETSEVVDRAAAGPGRDFAVTRALAARLGLEGDTVIQWRFAD